MAASKKAQIALVVGASALIAGAFVVWTMPVPEFMRKSESLTTVEKEADAAAKSVIMDDDSSKTAQAASASPQTIEQLEGKTAVGSPKGGAVGNYTGAMHGNAAASAKPKKAESNSALPAFDIVRIGPAGDSVIAGRVTPGKTLELLLNGHVHERIEPRATGTFAMTPPTMPPGDHQLTLREIGPDGESTLSRQAVTVMLSPDLVSAPVIALTEPDKPTIVLAGPGLVTRQPGDDDLLDEDGEPIAAKEITERKSATDKTLVNLPKTVAIATVEAEGGRLFVSGSAPKGASVRLYLNDTFLAAGNASARGAITFTIDSGITDGDYRVRLDEVSPKDGKVISRAEVPFVVKNASAQPPAGAQAETASEAKLAVSSSDDAHVVVPEVRTTRVEHGDSLWQISRRAYGEGTRYTVIYGANQKQIRNPDLIYPGQVFVVPNGSEKPAAR